MEICNLYDTTLKNREKRMKTIGLFLILVLLFACSSTVEIADQMDPENFRYLEGTLVHFYKNTLLVKSDDGQKMYFRVGRNTVFIPKEGRRFRDFLFIGDRLRIRYFNKAYSDLEFGDYFIGFEVRRLNR